ncbi:WD40-repeat-containing domain protein [Suillus discolor]|uniref:WD40-repeat-containing domain protein n=1 Tax=Suillus discolor TaxID=1912936 RepID=A0A9P7FE69_9AGAM|nr:WD40-repeat-containing domain protein [Suillus discolor]KAG2115852.1 WD40-repeat-containing domain protein [Suillus discolor]
MPINVRSMEHQDISPAVLQSSNSTSPVKTSATASNSMRPVEATKKLTLKPIMTLEGHKRVTDGVINAKNYRQVSFISYFPLNGKGILGASNDKTTRQWDLRNGKEIEEARDVREPQTQMMALSGDGQWVVTSRLPSVASYIDVGKVEARNVETKIVKTFEGHFDCIDCIDVSADRTLLVGGSWGGVWIWSMETGKLVAGPFRFVRATNRSPRPPSIGMVRFSQDSKKFAISSGTGRRLEVWDVQTHKLDEDINTNANILDNQR